MIASPEIPLTSSIASTTTLNSYSSKAENIKA